MTTPPEPASADDATALDNALTFTHEQAAHADSARVALAIDRFRTLGARLRATERAYLRQRRQHRRDWIERTQSNWTTVGFLTAFMLGGLVVMLGGSVWLFLPVVMSPQLAAGWMSRRSRMARRWREEHPRPSDLVPDTSHIDNATGAQP